MHYLLLLLLLLTECLCQQRWVQGCNILNSKEKCLSMGCGCIWCRDAYCGTRDVSVEELKASYAGMCSWNASACDMLQCVSKYTSQHTLWIVLLSYAVGIGAALTVMLLLNVQIICSRLSYRTKYHSRYLLPLIVMFSVYKLVGHCMGLIDSKGIYKSACASALM